MRAILLPILILTALAAIGLSAFSQLELDYRLDAFLPTPDDPDQALVVDQISLGPGGRMILAAISGAPADELIDSSRRLASRWRELPDVERVENGEFEVDALTEERLMQARFVLLPDPGSRLTDPALGERLAERIDELALAGPGVEPLIRRDPLGLLPELADRLTRVGGERHSGSVWLDQNNERALLVVHSVWPGFAVEEQARLVDALRTEFRGLAGAADLELTLAGAPVIAVDSAERSRRDGTVLSLAASAFLLAILTLAWRSVPQVLAGAIPLFAGAVCGLLVTALVFDGVHGLTLAFGFTLLGVALDYPIHLFGHGRGRRMATAARHIASPLLLGAASTIIAYLAVWLTTQSGLGQLGLFSAAGLATAAGATLLLPRLGIEPSTRNPTLAERMPYSWWLPPVAGLIAIAALVIQGDQRWSNDLSRLSPTNTELLATDRELRQALDPGDVRHLLVASDAALEPLLQIVEDTVGVLEQARAEGLIDGWQAVTDLVPSYERQAQRRAAWPDAGELEERLATAAPRFRDGAFEPFLADLAGLDERPWLTPESWDGTALTPRVATLLDRGENGWRALIMLSGLADAAALEAWLRDRPTGASLVDLKASSEYLVAAYRQDAGQGLAMALLLITGLLLLRVGRPRLTLAILLPPLAAVACTAALMARFDGGLTIVHLVGLLLAAGIGLDFSLFARTLARDRPTRARTNQAINLCALSSGGVFLILGQSDIGLLRMLGLTAFLGILLSWLFARLSQPPCRLI
ncbi:MAG: MMPL family transporter [Wenzhouxiangella sp.]|jgi:predicted exporter|nr:MMPL family transporter [Wenzhouxiangella sp.]